MKKPYIVWTMRRTGGTALAALLAKFTPFPIVEHEPFNHGRAYGHVATEFDASGDIEGLQANMQEILASKVCIKHCYDILPLPLHAALLEEAARQGYTHLVLDRVDETARLFSLELAQRTKAWSKEDAERFYPAIVAGEQVLEPIDIGRLKGLRATGSARRDWLCERFSEARISPHVVFYEDIYDMPDKARSAVYGVLHAAGVDEDTDGDVERAVAQTLEGSAQKSHRLFSHVPNYEALVEALASDPLKPNPFLEFRSEA